MIQEVDKSKIYEEKCLVYAEKVAEFWLNLQSKLGLIPNRLDKSYTHLDNKTDFAVALLKLYALTENKKYKNAAIKIIDGVIKFHRTDRGYVTSVDAKSGEIVNYEVKTKFNSLFLKPLIAIDREDEIYKDKKLYNILRDR